MGSAPLEIWSAQDHPRAGHTQCNPHALQVSARPVGWAESSRPTALCDRFGGPRRLGPPYYYYYYGYLYSLVLAHERSTSATLQAWAMQPRGV